MHPDEVSDLIVEACERLGASDVVLLLADLDQHHLNWLGGASTDPLLIDDSFAGEAHRTQLPVHGPARRASTPLWVPLMDSAERVGVLGVTLEDEVDLGLWTAVASLAGENLVAKTPYGDGIELTRRTEEVALSAEMRIAVLPPLTCAGPQVEVSGILEPACDIAGDTFDDAVNGSTVSIAVLDAMGHGMEASRMANVAVSAYRSARRRGRSLDELFRFTDEVIAEQFGDHRYVTGQMAELDVSSGRLRMINAGHPLPLLLRSGIDTAEVPCTPCLPIGLGAVEATEAELMLEPGDRVLFYTDGVTEARDAQRAEFDSEALGRIVGSLVDSGHSGAEILRLAIRALHDHNHGVLRDDATLVLITFRGSG